MASPEAKMIARSLRDAADRVWDSHDAEKRRLSCLLRDCADEVEYGVEAAQRRPNGGEENL